MVWVCEWKVLGLSFSLDVSTVFLVYLFFNAVDQALSLPSNEGMDYKQSNQGVD